MLVRTAAPPDHTFPGHSKLQPVPQGSVRHRDGLIPIPVHAPITHVVEIDWLQQICLGDDKAMLRYSSCRPHSRGLDPTPAPESLTHADTAFPFEHISPEYDRVIPDD